MKDYSWIIKYNKENNNENEGYFIWGKYLAVHRYNHAYTNSDGCMFIHRLQAEKKLGRYLSREECVHHIDENKFNNSIDNLMVFKTRADHAAYHMGCDIYLDGDVWVANRTMSLCPICGKSKEKTAKYCVKCYLQIKKSNSLKPTKDILSKQITQLSFVSIGKLYGVSDNAVRKWCKSYDLPYKRKDIKQFIKNNDLSLYNY